MTGLLVKDLYELKKLWIQPRYLVTSVVITLAGIAVFNSSALIISIFISVFFINTIQTLFVEDKKNGWNLFVKTIKISSFKIVLARYLLSILVCLALTFINAGISKFLWLMYRDLSFQEYLILTLIFLTVTLTYIFVMLPFFYLFDENGLTIGILLGVLLVFLISRISGLSEYVITFLSSITNFEITFIGISILLLLGITSFICSFLILKWKG